MHRGKVDPGVSELPRGNELSRDHVNRPLVLKKAKIMTSHEGLILRRNMAENSKNVSTSQSKISMFMIFPENIAN